MDPVTLIIGAVAQAAGPVFNFFGIKQQRMAEAEAAYRARLDTGQKATTITYYVVGGVVLILIIAFVIIVTRKR